MTVHIMLDIETLGTRPGFVVMSAAFVRFSDFASTTCNLSIPEQQALGLEIDPATHQWWGTQPPEAWTAATENAVPLADGLGHFAAWLEWAHGGAHSGYGGDDMLLWCHGASFDAPLLGEVYRRAGVPLPWSFRDIRDTRTLYDLAGVDIRAEAFRSGQAHRALDDAIGQTKAAIEALRILSARQASA